MPAFTLTHIGGPTTLIETNGWRILTDPTFDAPGRTYRFGWGTSSRKTTGPAIPASQIGPIDVVLLTHEHHADNLDVSGRSLLPTAGVVITTASGARRLGPNVRGLRNWQSTRIEGSGRSAITVTATPCRHGPPGSHPIVATSSASPSPGTARSTALCGSRVTRSSTAGYAASPAASCGCRSVTPIDVTA